MFGSHLLLHFVGPPLLLGPGGWGVHSHWHHHYSKWRVFAALSRLVTEKFFVRCDVTQ